MSSKPTAWEVVQMARDLSRPTSQYFIENIFTDFTEMHGDRIYGDDAAIVGGIGLLDDIPVTVIGQEKGVSLSEKARCNFGSAHPEGYRKSLRLMKQAEKFGRPVICIVDTQGAFCGVGAEERGMGEAIARNMLELSRLRTPVISILIGEGGSGGAIALAVSDRIAMLENSIYSILSPEGFSSILWKEAARAPEAAELMRMTAPEVLQMGLIDDLIKEPAGGARADDGGTYAQEVKRYLTETLRVLRSEPIENLLRQRYDKFRGFGQPYISPEVKRVPAGADERPQAAQKNQKTAAKARRGPAPQASQPKPAAAKKETVPKKKAPAAKKGEKKAGRPRKSAKN